MKRNEIFMESIHDEDYEKQYRELPITHAQMIYDTNRVKESLNGTWCFQVDQYDTCLRGKWFEERERDAGGRPLPLDYTFEAWDKTPVPSCWNLQTEKYFYYEGPAVYTRTFKYEKKEKERVFLKFGAVNYEAKVFLNRKFIGFHQGGSTPFYIEVTGQLQDNNRLLVVADNTRKTTAVPCKNTDWFNYGGIYREVALFRVPETFLKDFTIYLVPGSSFKKIHISLRVDGQVQNSEALLTIPELDITASIPVRDGNGSIEIEASPRLWSPENPKLYEVNLSYVSDQISDQIGFREIKVIGTDIFLNGEKIFLKGVCAHEESVTNGKAITEKEIRETFRLAKEMHCNYLRLAHYPHTEKAARIADEMGLMLWEEIPVYWAIAFEHQPTLTDAGNQLQELIKRDQNRASVVIWSVGNENADTDARLNFMSSLAKKARELDPTRLVSAACLVDAINLKMSDRLIEYLDVVGMNEYYGWYEPDITKLEKLLRNNNPTKPVIICEFGADARLGAKGGGLGTEKYQEELYRLQITTLSKCNYIKGLSPWIFYDFRCPRRSHFLQRGYNTKGLLSGDKKRKKKAFYVMQEFYKSIKKT